MKKFIKNLGDFALFALMSIVAFIFTFAVTSAVLSIIFDILK